MKRTIRLTEADLRHIVKESVNEILTEGRFRRNLVKSLTRAGNDLDKIRKANPKMSDKEQYEKVSWRKHPLAKAAITSLELNNRLKGRETFDDKGEQIRYKDGGGRYGRWLDKQMKMGDDEWEQRYEDYVNKNAKSSRTHDFTPPTYDDFVANGSKGTFAPKPRYKG